eukprot:UN23119
MVAMGLDTLVYDDFSGSDNEAIYGWETFTFKTSLGEQDYEYCDYETGNEDRQTLSSWTRILFYGCFSYFDSCARDVM